MQGGSVGTNSRALCLVPKVCLSSDPKQHSGRCVSAANLQENERAGRNGRLAPETTNVLPALHPAHHQPAHSTSRVPVQLCSLLAGTEGPGPGPCQLSQCRNSLCMKYFRPVCFLSYGNAVILVKSTVVTEKRVLY